LPYVHVMTNGSADRRGTSKDRGKGIRSATSVVLWRPEVVLARNIVGADPRPSVRLAEPNQRPESVRVRVETARSILNSLAEAREDLSARLTAAQERAHAAQTERERVFATMDAYRLEAKLDDVLTTTSTQVSLLMKERGLR
jgi:hypothetical protein